MPEIKIPNLDKLAAHKYRWAKVLAVHSDWDTVDIELLDENSQPTGEQWQDVPLFYHCTPDAQLRPNGALEGAAAAFGDLPEVIVEVDNGGEVRRVVARRDGLKACESSEFPVLVSKVIKEAGNLGPNNPPYRQLIQMKVYWVSSNGQFGVPEPNNESFYENLEIEAQDSPFFCELRVNGVVLDSNIWTYSDYPQTGPPRDIEVLLETTLPFGMFEEGDTFIPLRIRVSGKNSRGQFEYWTEPFQFRQCYTEQWTANIFRYDYEAECPRIGLQYNDSFCKCSVSYVGTTGKAIIFDIYLPEDDYQFSEFGGSPDESVYQYVLWEYNNNPPNAEPDCWFYNCNCNTEASVFGYLEKYVDERREEEYEHVVNGRTFKFMRSRKYIQPTDYGCCGEGGWEAVEPGWECEIVQYETEDCEQGEVHCPADFEGEFAPTNTSGTVGWYLENWYGILDSVPSIKCHVDFTEAPEDVRCQNITCS